jgi:hypothetical protein
MIAPRPFARFRRHAFVFVTGARVALRYDAAAAETAHHLHRRHRRARASASARRSWPCIRTSGSTWADIARARGLCVAARAPSSCWLANELEIRLPLRRRAAGAAPAGGRRTSMPGRCRRCSGRRRAASSSHPASDGTSGHLLDRQVARAGGPLGLAGRAGPARARPASGWWRRWSRSLEDWFDGAPPNRFHYDRTWRTLVGEPPSTARGWELNDHHFHYGQFVFAAATVARFDPAWAALERWGGLVDLLITDCANPDRERPPLPLPAPLRSLGRPLLGQRPAPVRRGATTRSLVGGRQLRHRRRSCGARLTGRPRCATWASSCTPTSPPPSSSTGSTSTARTSRPGSIIRPGHALGHAAASTTPGGTATPSTVHGINFCPFTGGSLYLGAPPRPGPPQPRRADSPSTTGPSRGCGGDISLDVQQGLARARGGPGPAGRQPRVRARVSAAARPFVYHWLHLACRATARSTTACAPRSAHTTPSLRAGATRHHRRLQRHGAAPSRPASPTACASPWDRSRQKVVSTRDEAPAGDAGAVAGACGGETAPRTLVWSDEFDGPAGPPRSRALDLRPWAATAGATASCSSTATATPPSTAPATW